jgi:signal transduction histidine kinase
MRYLQAETDGQMLVLCESLLRAQTASRCRRAFMHDIRNPAQSIQSGLELLERVVTAKTSKVSAEQCITLIRQSLANLQRTVERTLDGVAPSGGTVADLAPKALLDEFAQLLINDAASRSVNIRVDVDPSLRVRGTSNRVRQLLLSLLVDALDAVDAAGVITVAATTSPEGCTLLLTDSRDTSKPTSNDMPGLTPEPILSGEQWWQALLLLVQAEQGVLEREQRADQYVVRLKLPCGGDALLRS